MKSPRSYLLTIPAVLLLSAVSCTTVPLGTGSTSEVLALVNQYRASGATCSGTGTSWGATTQLQRSANLTTIADEWTKSMRSSGRLSHGNPKARINGACPRPGYVGENIACNPSAAGAVRRWMASRSGHCEVIMDPRFNAAGVGYAAGGVCGGYWTIDFAGNC